METEIRTHTAARPAGIVVADARSRVRDGLCQAIRVQPDLRVMAACETSQDAWRFLRQRRPEVLLLDWRLPDTGAMILLRRLEPGADLNIILLTDERDPAVLAEAMILGARGAISGSASPETLLRCARRVLGGELWFSRDVTRALRDRINSEVESPPRCTPDLEELLTPREVDVVRAIVRGLSNCEIGDELGISYQTVRHHLKSVFGKLHVSSRLELALLAAPGVVPH